MSREALSLDISRLVARVVAGESIDTAERGAALAAQYPDLGISGALIGQAIDRAAGMVGMIRSAPRPAKLSRESVGHSSILTLAEAPPVDVSDRIAAQWQPNVPPAEPEQALLPPAEPLEIDASEPFELSEAFAAPSLTSTTVSDARSIENRLAAAIDPDSGSLAVSDRKTKQAGSSAIESLAPSLGVRGEPEPQPADTLPDWANGDSHVPPTELGNVRTANRRAPTPGSIFSSFRRALFRA